MKRVFIMILFLILFGASSNLSHAQHEELLIDDFNDGDLNNKVGGAWEVWLRTKEDTTQNCKATFVKDEALGNQAGQSVLLDYDVESENPAYNGFRAYLNDFDGNKFKMLNLYLKGDTAAGFPPNLKIELIGPDKRPSPYMITGITDQWQKFSVPLSEFFVVQDWTKLYQFVVVFADITSNPQKGAVYLDQVSFS